jgi:diguanylate cyclase (GGDEF)-like protein
MPTHLSMAPQVLAVSATPDAPWLNALQAYCAHAALSCASVPTPDALLELATVHPTVVVLSGAWTDAACRMLIGYARAAAPEAAVVLCCDDATPDALELDAAGLFGACPGHDARELARWVHAAVMAVEGQAHLREHQTQSLTSLANAMRNVDPFAGVLFSVLTTAINVLSHDGILGLSGAILLVDDTGTLTFGTGVAPLQDEVPPEGFAVAERAAERLEVVRDDVYTAMPLQWRDHPHGVLLLAGAALPDPLPPLARLLVDFTSAALENSVLFELAAVDSTTRTFTRTYAIKRLYEALKSTFRSGQELSVLMLDMDRFKQINDTFGHLTGDRVLRDVGGVLYRALRETDTVGRYGGDEFLIVLPNTGTAGAEQVARRIAHTVETYRLPVDNFEISVEISIGIGGIVHMDGDSIGADLRPGHDFFQHALERVIAQADGLMYAAKHGPTLPHVSSAIPLSWRNLARLGK